MSNMSYCRFHNTYLDLRDCANVIAEALDNGLTYNEFIAELSKDEQYYFKRLVLSAQDIIGFEHELKESQKQESN